MASSGPMAPMMRLDAGLGQPIGVLPHPLRQHAVLTGQQQAHSNHQGNGRIRTTAMHLPNAPPGALTPVLVDVNAVLASLPAAIPPRSSSFSSSLATPPSSGRSRRPSESSAVSVSTASDAGSSPPRRSFESRLRASPLGSNSSRGSIPTSFDSILMTTSRGGPQPPTSAQYQQLQSHRAAWQRLAPSQPYRPSAKPGQIFAQLPGEVLELILEELRAAHLQPGGYSCATCWMRDCCSVALSARKFLKYARVALYEHIELNGAESQAMKKRVKSGHGGEGRLVLLRRTLRERGQIAHIVHSLKVPAMPSGVGVDEYNDLVASVVMACPSLERLLGFYPAYNHAFQRLFHALSTRHRLKEMNWILEPSPFQRQRRIHTNGLDTGLLAPGDLQPFQSASFVEHHRNWQSLTTLTVHCHPGATLTPDSLLEKVIHQLPCLQNLYLSRLPKTSFDDRNLLSLPRLKKLSLVYVAGVTVAGLSSFATKPTSLSIQSLTLVGMNVDSLPAIARILSHLPVLTTLNFVQSRAPAMPADEFIWLFPYLASQSLLRLHWDTPSRQARASPADRILARSIAACGFPRLRYLRAPNDPEGVFQALCRPRESVKNPADRYCGGLSQTPVNGKRPSSAGGGGTQGNHKVSGRDSGKAMAITHERTLSGFSASGSINSRGSNNSRPASPQHGTGMGDSSFPGAQAQKRAQNAGTAREHSDLHQARLAAQARLEAARRFPRYMIWVSDENGQAGEKHGMGAFLGTVESQINYVLNPDMGASDEGGGLVGISELLGDCGEGLFLPGGGGGGSGGTNGKLGKKDTGKKEADDTGKARQGCVGRWNAQVGTAADKKAKERWWHTERGRWRGVTLA